MSSMEFRRSFQMGSMSRNSSRMETSTTLCPEREVELTKSSSGISLATSSMGSVMRFSTRSGRAPGKFVTIIATRMMKPGSICRGIAW